ncbi:MAG TPA: SlyX family protein [Pusillimonas sp.]|uniref:SlyX family protein n=1 Tax=Pusillimonas sp. TaxID=3040095 RepID=UPI002BB5D0D5|nr:SlyX family protein [Pusillimonas sp.]HUH87227.1 SlyX family protein [Pusillimonas sp.]
MDSEQRFIDIEIKLTAQEDLTQQLGDLVYEQQKQLDELRALYRVLAQRFSQGEADGPDPYTQERPPHY